MYLFLVKLVFDGTMAKKGKQLLSSPRSTWGKMCSSGGSQVAFNAFLCVSTSSIKENVLEGSFNIFISIASFHGVIQCIEMSMMVQSWSGSYFHAILQDGYSWTECPTNGIMGRRKLQNNCCFPSTEVRGGVLKAIYWSWSIVQYLTPVSRLLITFQLISRVSHQVTRSWS